MSDENIVESSKSLEDLKVEEKSLSDKIIELEGEHKELSCQHRACNNELRKLQGEIEIIKNSLRDCKSRFDTIVTRADDIAQHMNDISVLRREKMATLGKVRQEIEDKSNVIIYVYNDGTIEAPENPEFILDDDGYIQLKTELAEREECLDLRVREVTILARLLKICERAEYFTLVCDSRELEEAFKAIRQ